MNVSQLQVDFHDRVLNGRAIDKIINSDAFVAIYRNSTEEELKNLDEILRTFDKVDLKIWMDDHSFLPLDDWSILRMHSLASKLNIYNYSRMPKVDLAIAIRKQQETKNEES